MTFKTDLEIWVRFESFVIKVSNLVFWLKVSKNEDLMGVDLIWEWFEIEVKYDKQFRKTWNFYIEYLYKWERSWILKYNAEYFCVWDENNFWIFNRQELWNWCTVFGRKAIWWDDSLTNWFLIEWREVVPLAIYKYERKRYTECDS